MQLRKKDRKTIRSVFWPHTANTCGKMRVAISVKVPNFRTPENFGVKHLWHRAEDAGMLMECQTVPTLIRLLLKELL